jgi:hypothetical protein
MYLIVMFYWLAYSGQAGGELSSEPRVPSAEPPLVVSQSETEARLSQLFQEYSLIPYDFERGRTPGFLPDADSSPQQFSIFSLSRSEKSGELTLSTKIPDEFGKIKGEGRIAMNFRPGLWGGQVELIWDGYVWTPRVERIGKVDLSGENKITELPEFDFDSFSKCPEVIPLANHYLVNLFGAIIQDRKIIRPGSKKTYLNNEGKKLHGRIISKVERHGKVILEETVLK